MGQFSVEATSDDTLDEFLGTASTTLDNLSPEVLLIAGSVSAASIILLGLVYKLQQDPDSIDHGQSDKRAILASKILIGVWIVSAFLIVILPIIPQSTNVSLSLFWVVLILIGLGIWMFTTVTATLIMIRLRKEIDSILRLQMSLIQVFVLGGIVFLTKLAYSIVQLSYDFRSGPLAFFVLYTTIVLIVSMFSIAYSLLGLIQRKQ